MDEQNQNKSILNNVIQFPSRKKEVEAPKAERPSAAAKTAKKPRVSKKTLGATVLAVMLFSGAANRYVFSQKSETMNISSVGGESAGRAIASVERVNWTRDAAWEKDLAERLAAKQTRELASIHIGRPATKEEKLRWGVLEEKYTINYSPDDHGIRAILLQDAQTTRPAYILDREQFLSEFGHLMKPGFESAKLKSVESAEGKTIESYTLFGKDKSVPAAEAHFELDRHKRLLSLKVEPAKI